MQLADMERYDLVDNFVCEKGTLVSNLFDGWLEIIIFMGHCHHTADRNGTKYLFRNSPDTQFPWLISLFHIDTPNLVETNIRLRRSNSHSVDFGWANEKRVVLFKSKVFVYLPIYFVSSIIVWNFGENLFCFAERQEAYQSNQVELLFVSELVMTTHHLNSTLTQAPELIDILHEIRN